MLLRNSQKFHDDLDTSCLITFDAVLKTDDLKGVSIAIQSSSEIRSQLFLVSSVLFAPLHVHSFGKECFDRHDFEMFPLFLISSFR